MEDEGSTVIQMGKMKAGTNGDDAGVDHGERPIRARRHRKRSCLIAACCLVVLLIIVVCIILAFTLLKPKDPRFHVDSVSLDSFQMSVGLNIPPTITLNVSLGLVLSIFNPNRASLKYTNSTSYMFYRDVEVGSIPIPAGYLAAHGTERIPSVLSLMADRIISNPHILGDVNNGSLPFSTSTHMSGRANVLGVFKHHVSTSSLCSFSILTTNLSIAGIACTYDFQL